MNIKMLLISTITLFAFSNLYAEATTPETPKATYYTGRNISLSPNASAEELSKSASQVRPAARQIRWQEYGTLGFIHFNINSFTDRGWGTGTEDLSLFNPTELDADQWIRTFKAAGVSSVILVAKHHDGFRLWPSKHHPRNISKSPFRNGKGDLVAEVAKACRRHRVRLCLYYSPWDMQKPYGTAAYNDLMIAELTELLSGYGWIDLIWFDGAGINPKISGVKMDFDWPRIYSTIRKLQPQALISGAAPDIRWVGNEGGRGRFTEWSVQGIKLPEKDFSGFHSKVPLMKKNLGHVADLLQRGPMQLAWFPARGGLPVHTKWFWNSRAKTRPLGYLVKSFFETVGSNSGLLINLSPDTRGLIPDTDVAVMRAFGAWRTKLFAIDHAEGAVAEAAQTRDGGHHPNYLFDDDLRTGWVAPKGQKNGEIIIQLTEPKTFDVVLLQEMIVDFGQRIEKFKVDAEIDGQWKEIGAATTVGMRRLLRVKPSTTRRVRIRITDSRQAPSLAHVELLTQPPVKEPSVSKKQPMLSRKTWKAPKEIMDGDITTCWSKELALGKPAHLDIDLGSIKSLSQLTYVPPPGSPVESGRIEAYAVYLGKDGKSWPTDAIAEGKFGNIDNNPVAQHIALPKGTHARYVRLTAFSATRRQKVVRIAEIHAAP